MTRRATITPAVALHVDWKTSLGRMQLGDKLLLHNLTQAQCGAACSRWSREGRRYVSKRHPVEGVYVIRVL